MIYTHLHIQKSSIEVTHYWLRLLMKSSSFHSHLTLISFSCQLFCKEQSEYSAKSEISSTNFPLILLELRWCYEILVLIIRRYSHNDAKLTNFWPCSHPGIFVELFCKWPNFQALQKPQRCPIFQDEFYFILLYPEARVVIQATKRKHKQSKFDGRFYKNFGIPPFSLGCSYRLDYPVVVKEFVRK